jgi:triosephosphate isomerase
MKTFVINFKNYPEILGNNSVRLATDAIAAAGTRIELVLALPTPMLSQVSERANVSVFAQSVTEGEVGQSTGAIIPESVREAGAVGTILNHSEARVEPALLKRLVPRARAAGLKVCLCTATPSEARDLVFVNPDYIAIEPPELIGGGVAVSTARPEVVTETVKEVLRAGFRKKILCGAGIVDGKDVTRALQLGVDGILVSSSVVKAKDWRAKVSELARPLASARP